MADDYDIQVEEHKKKLKGAKSGAQEYSDFDAQVDSIKQGFSNSGAKPGTIVLNSEPDWKETALDAVTKTADFLDTAGRTSRTFIYEYTDPTHKMGSKLSRAAKAAGEAFSDPSKGVSGEKLGLERQMIPAEAGDFQKAATGLAIELITDPINYIPFGALIKASARGGKAGVEAVAKAAKAGVKIASDVTPTAVKSTVEGLGKKLAADLSSIINPKQSKNFDELAAIADKHAIPRELLPEAVEFGEHSTISKMASVQRQLFNEAANERFVDGLRKVTGALDNVASKTSGGVVLSKEGAGQAIREGFDEAAKQFFKQRDVTYSQIIKDYPGLKLQNEALEHFKSQATAAIKYWKGQANRGTTDTMREAVEVLRNYEQALKNTRSFKQFYEFMSDVGKIGWANNSNKYAKLSVNEEGFRNLYKQMSSALVDTIRYDTKGGLDEAARLIQNNKEISDFLGETSALKKIIGNKLLANEQVYDRLITRGSSDQINNLRAIIETSSPQTWAMIKGTYLDGLIKQNADGIALFKTTANNLAKDSERAARVLDDVDIKDFSDVLKLGNGFGDLVMNKSRSGEFLTLAGAKDKILDYMTNEGAITALKKRARNISKKEVSKQATKKPISILPGAKTELGFRIPGAVSKPVKSENERE